MRMVIWWLRNKTVNFVISFFYSHFSAFGGDEHGSTYLQAFDTYLREEYLQRPLDRIYLMVKQHMAKAQQVVAFFENPSRLIPCFP